MLKVFLNIIAILALTVLTQLGGLAWTLALLFRRKAIAFTAFYVMLSVGAMGLAPMFGRVPLPCGHSGPLQMHSMFYCALNRHYVVPEVAETLRSIAEETERAFPGTVVQVLDANFPFLTGFPLLPHLLHNDGRKADLALFYQSDGSYLPGRTRSPVGYFAFEDGPTDCPDNLLSLRWDFEWLKLFWADLALDEERVRFVTRGLADDPRVTRIFLEPHLKERLGLNSEKIRFQGCRAARHDDHIHLQL